MQEQPPTLTQEISAITTQTPNRTSSRQNVIGTDVALTMSVCGQMNVYTLGSCAWFLMMEVF